MQVSPGREAGCQWRPGGAALGWRGWQAGNPKSNTVVEWPDCCTGSGPWGFPVPVLGCLVGAFPPSWCPAWSPPSLPLGPGMAQTALRNLLGASTLRASRTVIARGETRESLGRKRHERGLSQAGNRHVFLCFPQTGCFHTAL